MSSRRKPGSIDTGVSYSWLNSPDAGGNRGSPANDPEIVAAINGSWIDAYGFEFSAPMAAIGVSTSEIDPNETDPAIIAVDMTINIFSGDDMRVVINELANNHPLILGRMGAVIGHAMVLTAVS